MCICSGDEDPVYCGVLRKLLQCVDQGAVQASTIEPFGVGHICRLQFDLDGSYSGSIELINATHALIRLHGEPTGLECPFVRSNPEFKPYLCFRKLRGVDSSNEVDEIK